MNNFFFLLSRTERIYASGDVHQLEKRDVSRKKISSVGKNILTNKSQFARISSVRINTEGGNVTEDLTNILKEHNYSEYNLTGHSVNCSFDYKSNEVVEGVDEYAESMENKQNEDVNGIIFCKNSFQCSPRINENFTINFDHHNKFILSEENCNENNGTKFSKKSEVFSTSLPVIDVNNYDTVDKIDEVVELMECDYFQNNTGNDENEVMVDVENSNSGFNSLNKNEVLPLSSTFPHQDSNGQENINGVREILEFDYFSKELIKVVCEHARINKCDYELKCVSRRRYGIRTKFCYKCDNCSYSQFIDSENPDTSERMGINKASVLGTVNIGIGYTQLMELFASMNIHCMTDNVYRTNQNLMLSVLENAAINSMKQAGEEEKQLAIENNDLHCNIPWITVVTDGSWMTRSYGTNYNSLSGCGVIIGMRTKKVLHIGIRNKYCAKCAFAERTGAIPKVHKCYKNWDRNAPSSAMESDAILEGFKSSITEHGLIYKIIVTDGDSNVHKTLVDRNVYGDYNLIPIRIRCYNHLQRNLCTKLTAVSNTTQAKGSEKIENFYVLRALVSKNILTIRSLVEESVDYRKSIDEDWKIKKDELRKDILNIPCHIFGDHERCNDRAYKCNENNKPITERETNNVPAMQTTGMYQKIEEAIQYISNYCESLLHKLTNNIAESFNNLICVEIGGKRINFGLRSQYLMRGFAAVLRHNTQQLLTETYASICESVPQLILDVDERRQLKVARNRQYRNANGRKRKFPSRMNSNKHYGTTSQEIDLSKEDMKILSDEHLKKLKDNQENREEIERRTRDQHDSMEWICLRKQLLTSRHFGIVIRSRNSTSCATRVKEILYPSTERSPQMQYGIDHEPDAIKQLEAELQIKIMRCGLYIDSEHACLACTPDGLISDDDGIVEIKCPFNAVKLTAEEAVKTVKCLKGIFKQRKGTYELNKNHHFYYQVQGQLHITTKSYCIFVMWTPKSMIHVRVYKDNEFWKKKMQPILLRFYTECLLPEIIDSRHNRNMHIRDPEYILKAKEDKKMRDEEKKRNKLKVKGQIESENETDSDDENANECLIPKNNAKLSRNKNIIEETTMSIDAEVSSDEMDDVIFVSHDPNYIPTELDGLNVLTYIQEREITIEVVRTNVLTLPFRKLNDESLDAFVRLVQDIDPLCQIRSVLYVSYPRLVIPIQEHEGVLIIGGNVIEHWRVAHYKNNIVKIYDTLLSHTKGLLHEAERILLDTVFPNAKSIVFQTMAMQQPDGVSCGVYSAAMVIDIFYGINPSVVNYSRNINTMREHFVRLIQHEELLQFPRQ